VQAQGLVREVPVREEGGRAMWISLFAIMITAAICLSVAAFMMQSATHRSS
jgi:hypothetical protein